MEKGQNDYDKYSIDLFLQRIKNIRSNLTLLIALIPFAQLDLLRI